MLRKMLMVEEYKIYNMKRLIHELLLFSKASFEF